MMICMAAGVFLGNWLVVPMFGKTTRREGFWVGLIAAAIILGFVFFTEQFHKS